MAGPDVKFEGVTFATVQAAIADLYFRHNNMTQEEFDRVRQFVVPMQHNFVNPIQPGTQDTWIQYWIDSDDRMTHDRNERPNLNATQKVAQITLRFLGTRGEAWAKSFHHLTKRRHTAIIFMEYCNAMLLPYVSPIVPRNVDYFGAANATKAFTLSFKLQYDEVLDYSAGSGADRLEYISFAAGQMANEQTVEGGIL